MFATILRGKSAVSKSARNNGGASPTQGTPRLRIARRSVLIEAAPAVRRSDGNVWHGIGDERSPACTPLRNEDIAIDENLGLQRARSGDYLRPSMQGEYGERAHKNLFVITRNGIRVAPESTPFDTERGVITHTNLAPAAAVVAGELWASASAPWLWKINSGSKRFPLQDALVFNEKKLLWEVPGKGTPERARLDKQWEAVAAYMLTVGAAVVMQTPLDQRFENKLDFKIFIREDILQHEMEFFMRCAPSEWKKLIRQRLQQAQAAQLEPESPAEMQAL